MLQQFNNQNELVVYLRGVEERLQKLEAENETLRSSQTGIPDKNAIVRYISSRLPVTNLLNPSFLKRSFTVWGHFMVANLIIGITIGVFYACLMMVLFGSLFGNFLQNTR